MAQAGTATLARADAPGPASLRGFGPVLDAGCRVLVLGSFPGRASLSAGHYYAHPRNAFWSIVGEVLCEPLDAMDFDARYPRLLARGVGLWDVIDACRREGSLDANIRDARANDFAVLRSAAPALQRVLFNGRTAARYERAMRAAGYDVRVLPSTSPAHAAMSRQEKLARWREAFGSLVSAPAAGSGRAGP